jgi:hypothetical protein
MGHIHTGLVLLSAETERENILTQVGRRWSIRLIIWAKRQTLDCLGKIDLSDYLIAVPAGWVGRDLTAGSSSTGSCPL